MDMNELKVGDKVHVEFDGVVSEEPVSFGNGRLSCTVRINDTTAGGWSHDVCYASDAITKTGPDNWPPEPGDVWSVDGKDYYVRAHSWADTVVVESWPGSRGTSYSDSYETPGRKLDSFKALSPTLDRRRVSNGEEVYPF